MTPLSAHGPTGLRRDTPTPGWESGVWVRIQRQRRIHRLGAVLLAAAAAAGGGLLARNRSAPDGPRVGVATRLLGTTRADGSAALPATWHVNFEGAELRIYRNALGVLHRCPGSAACSGEGRRGTLELPVVAAGEYRAVVFAAASPGDGRTLEGDVTAARQRGEAVEMSSPLVAY